MAGRSQLPVQIMENKTRFDLNAAVENWRNELAAQPNLATDDRRELETHLRDAIAGFQQRGLNDEESFWLARRRVGQPQQICEEFVKADPAKVWRERVFWVAIALLMLQIWDSINFYFMAMIPNVLAVGDNFYSRLLSSTIFCGPIILIAIFLALGRMNKKSVVWSLLFSSRLLFVVWAAVLVLAANTLHEYSQKLYFFHTLPIEFRKTPNLMGLKFFGLSFLFGFIRPCLLIALIAWLMPPQNQKTPKRA
jgi:hypothetical protein